MTWGGIRVDFKEADDADRDARERELAVATKENTLEEAKKAHAEQVKLLKGEQEKLARREHITQTERTRRSRVETKGGTKSAGGVACARVGHQCAARERPGGSAKQTNRRNPTTPRVRATESHAEC